MTVFVRNYPFKWIPCKYSCKVCYYETINGLLPRNISSKKIIWICGCDIWHPSFSRQMLLDISSVSFKVASIPKIQLRLLIFKVKGKQMEGSFLSYWRTWGFLVKYAQLNKRMYNYHIAWEHLTYVRAKKSIRM